MAKKVRKDKKGRVLKKGESFKTKQNLYCFAYTDPFGVRKCFYAKDLPGLREKEEKMEKDRLDGLDIYVMKKASINYVFDRYIDTKKDLRRTTYTNYTYMYDRFVRGGFGKHKIADVRYSDVLKFYNALLDKGLQVNTLETIHSTLHPTFQLAVRDDILRSNPSDGVMAEVKKGHKSSNARHALTYEQERKFLEYLDTDEETLKWKSLFTVMFGTGMRIGEVVGLRWDDIDLKRGTISVNHSVTYYPRRDDTYRCEYQVSLPKTEAGIRTIPMLSKVKDAFIMEREHQKATGCCNIMELDGMSNFIFYNRNGIIHNPAAINRAIKRLVADCNAKEIIRAKREKREPVIVPMFSSHIARHTFCTRLCENDVNVKVIQTIMGHKDIQTTLDIYAEVSDGKKQQEVIKLEENGLL